MRELRTARELDLETRERRERLASTLDELSASLTPGRILDEVLSYAKVGGGNFLLGLGKSAAANPLPTLLVSTGCALFLSGRGGPNLTGRQTPSNDYAHGDRSRQQSGTEYERSVRGQSNEKGVVSNAADAVSGAATSVAEKVGSAASGVAAAASDLGSRIAETATGAAQTVTDQASTASESVVTAGMSARKYAEGTIENARGGVSSAQRRATLLGRELQGKAATAFEEYPLAVAAGGLLIGATLAALLPRTRIEDRYMGETSDTLKDAFLEGTADTVDRVAAGVENVVDAVSTKAGEEDLVGAAKGSIDELTSKVGKTLKAGREAINQELESANQR